MSYKITDTIIVDQNKNIGSIGIATFAGPVLIGGGTSTGTVSQPLQVTGSNGAYIGGNLGIGSTNPSSKLWVSGDIYNTGIHTAQVLSASKDPGTGIGTDFTNSLFGNGWRVSSPGSTTYYKLATLPPGGSGSTFDHLIINGVLGAWTNGNQTPFEITFSNRGSFNYKYVSYGSVRSDVKIIGISTNSNVEIWAQHQASQFTKLVYNIVNSIQSVVVSNPTSTTTAPVGTTVFDSSTVTPRFIINESDNVGIGTATPTSKLQVVGDVLVSGIVTANSFRGDGSLLTGITGGISSVSISTNTTNQSQYLTYAIGTGNTTGLGVSLTGLVFNPSSGNLGIGTTAPLQKLHVLGNLLVAAGSSTGQHITQKAYELNSGTLSWEGTAGQLFSITNNLTSGSIFSVNDVSGIPSIDVDASGTISLGAYGGNIGIGTTNATSKLDIFGNVKVTGIVTATTFSGTLSGYASSAGISTNLNGGLAGNIVYQSGPNATAFLANGTGGFVLQSNGVGNAPTWVAAAPSGAVSGITVRDSNNNLVGTSGSITQLTFGSGLFVTGTTGAAGIATITLSSNLVGSALSISGISTLGITSATNLTAQQLNVSGLSTFSGITTYSASLFGTQASFTGIVTATSFSGNASSATYATSSGIATYATSSGIATYATSAGIATYATNAGVSTYATSSGISTYATNAGVSTYATNAGIATYATNAGVSTYATNAGIATYATSAGIATYATNAGIATYTTTAGVSTSVIGGIGSITQLQVTGVSTFTNGPVLIGTGTSTGTASQLLQVTGGAYVSGNIGIGTTTPTSKLHVVGDVLVSGVTTASRFVSNVATGTAPLTVTSTTKVTNLNADLLDDNDSTYYTNASNLSSGTVPSARITASSGDFTVGQNLNVTGNISVGGTSVILNAATLQVKDKDIVLGITTNASNQDVSTDTTANHGGVAIASTEGTPLIDINGGVGTDSIPNTYKQIMWLKSGSWTGLGTDAWLFNYGVGIGSTQVPLGVRLAAGGMQVTDRTITTPQLSVTGVTTSGGFNATTGNDYKINGTSVLTSTTLGSGVVNSSLTSVGTLGSLSVTNATTSGLLSVTGVTTSGGVNVTTGNDYKINGTSVLTSTTLGSAVVTSSLTSVGTLGVLNVTGVTTSGGFNATTGNDYKINGTSVLTSTTLGSAVVNSSLTSVGTLGQLQVTGISTFTNGPVLIGSATSTGTASQPLQVTGGAYVSGNLGIGITNPSSKLQVVGVLGISSIGDLPSNWPVGRTQFSTSGLGFVLNHTDNSPIIFQTQGVERYRWDHAASALLIGTATATGTTLQALQVGSATTNLGAYVSGSVGIGTTTPGSKLTVNGNVLVSGVTTSGGVNVTTGNDYKINGTSVLTSTTLGSAVVNSSLTSVGTLGVLNVTGVTTSGGFNATTGNDYKINGTSVLTSTTLGSAVVNSSLTSVGTLGLLSVTGISTFNNGPVLIGTGTSTGTASQPLQVTGGAYVSGNLGIGTTNPFGSNIYSGLDVNRANVKIFARNIGTASDAAVWAADQDYFATPSYKGVGIVKFGPGTAGTMFSSIPYADTGVLSFQNTTTALIYTNGQSPLIFGTFSLERARFDGLTGNFGIGTTLPSSKLHVVGDAFVSGITTSGGFNATTGNDYKINGTSVLTNNTLGSGVVNSSLTSVGTLGILNVTGVTTSGGVNVTIGNDYKINGTSVLTSTTLGSAVVNSSLTSVGTLGSLSVTGISTFTNGPVLIGGGTSTGTSGQVLQVAGINSSVYIGGNLGIGTTNPTSKLWVGGDGYFAGIVTSSGFYVGGSLIGGSISGTNLVGTALSVSGISTFTNGPVLIGAATSTGTASQRLQVTGGAYVSGSVGIGTTNPGATLNVVPTASSIAGLFSGTTSSDMVRITQLGTGNALVVEDSANPDSSPFVVTGIGSVGIGTASPAFTADIAGDARVTSTNKMRFGGTAGTTNFYIQYNSTTNSLDFVAG